MSTLVTYSKLIWRIDNICIDSFRKYSKSKSLSKSFTILLPDKSVTSWIVEFFSHTNPCEFYIFKVNNENHNILLKSRLYLKTCDENLQLIDTIEGNCFELEENEGFGFSKMFGPKDMFMEGKNFINNCSLTFVIEVELHQEDTNVTLTNCDLNNGLLSTSDYQKIQECQNLSDFAIVCSDGEEILVHRLVIALRCPILMEMLNGEISDYGINKMKLNDVDSKTMNAFLRYLYTGTLDMDPSIYATLLYAAEKFQLNNLKSICISCLSNNICMQNVLDILLIADHHGDKILEENCFGFIKMKFDFLKNSDDWNKLSIRHVLKIMNSFEKCPILVQLRSSL